MQRVVIIFVTSWILTSIKYQVRPLRRHSSSSRASSPMSVVSPDLSTFPDVEMTSFELTEKRLDFSENWMVVRCMKFLWRTLLIYISKTDLRRWFIGIHSMENFRISYKPVETNKRVFKDPVSSACKYFLIDLVWSYDLVCLWPWFDVSLWKMLQMWTSCVIRDTTDLSSVQEFVL